jgi:endonuclease-3
MKAKNVIRMAQIILAEHGGEVPLERGEAAGAAGVGRKTASVVLNELRVEPAIAVDTHVFRRLAHGWALDRQDAGQGRGRADGGDPRALS